MNVARTPRAEFKAASSQSFELPKTLTYALDVRGKLAVDTVRQWGWQVVSPWNEFTIAGAAIKNDDFAVSRYRHSAAEIRYQAPPQFAGQMTQMLLACLDGELMLQLGEGRERLKPGQVVLVNPQRIIASFAEAPVSNLIIMYTPSSALFHDPAIADRAPDTYFKILVGAATSVLGSGVDPAEPGFSRVEKSLEELIWALATQSELRSLDPAGVNASHLYTQAVRHIALNAGNVETTVASISVALGVSRSSLTRVFAVTGDTPGAYLRRTRLALAERLELEGSTGAAVAQGAGFGTTRRLRRARANTSSRI